MNLNEYQQLAERTVNTRDGEKNEMVNYAMGLAGESGEIVDHMKKYIFHSHELDKTEMAKELGDILWYVANLADVLGFTLDEIAQMNINKLKTRYPSGFSEKDSRERVDVYS